MPYAYFEGSFGDPRGTQDANTDHSLTQRDVTGINYDITQSLAHRCNFSIELKEVKEYGKYVNGTWTGMIEMLRKRELDIGTELTPTKHRSEVADFSIGIQNEEFVLYQAPSKNTFNWKIYKNVFSDFFWICLFITIFSLTTCFFLIQFCSMGKYTIFIYH